MERNRGDVEEAQERSREHVLSGVLLHMIAAAYSINLALKSHPRLKVLQRRFEVMDHVAILRVRNFCDALFVISGD